MGIRINTGSGIDPKMVDQLIELEKQPIKKIQERRKSYEIDKELFDELSSLVKDLGTQLDGLRNPIDFRELKLESSHPDIIDGRVENSAIPGNYEMEVRSLAKTQKLLAEAYPDADETPVGFGYMTIENEKGESFDIDILPDQATLNDVAGKINAANAGVKAIVINTKENLEDEDNDSYRLLVINEESGKPAKVYVDPDTTWLEFGEQVTGKNLEVLFEDVPVYDDDNSLEALLPDTVLEVKRAEPGTKINISIDYDVDATAEKIGKWVESFNKVNQFIQKQFEVDSKTQKAGPLSKDNTLRSLRRALRSSLDVVFNGEGQKYATLAQVGITTDPKSGDLKYDGTKLSQALAEDYLGVAKLFVGTIDSPGACTRMSDKIREMNRGSGGLLKSRDREFRRVFENFDDELMKAERFADKRAEGIKRKFAALEGIVSGLNAQGDAMKARLGGG